MGTRGWLGQNGDGEAAAKEELGELDHGNQKLLKRRERSPGVVEGSHEQGGEGADVVRVGVGTPWRGQVGGAACGSVERVSRRGCWELMQQRLSRADALGAAV
ncbi:hypothetical protein ABZP36_011014 [Zizania latifolia]